jgi:hypothetical protein
MAKKAKEKEIPIVAEDPKCCGSCESYHPVNPGDEAGYCWLLPPVWIEEEGVGSWSRPVVEPEDIACRMYLRKLNS